MKNVLLLALLTLGISAHAQQKNYLSVEIDPAPFVLKGYSVSVKFSPKKLSHYSIMGSVYSGDLPDKLMSKENLDKGWKGAHINTSYALFTDYFIKEDRRGLHFGPSVFYYRKSIELKGSTETKNYSSIYPNIRIGYTFNFCKNSRLYIDPWLNFGKELNVDGNPKINSTEYKNNAFNYVMAVHVGYRIN